MSLLRRYTAPMPVHADDMNFIGEEMQARRNITGVDCVVDSTGTHFRSRPANPGEFRIRINAASSPGKYTGFFVDLPDGPLSMTGGLNDGDAGDDGAACAIFNSVERNGSTNALTEAENTIRYFKGPIIGYLDDGTPVVEITGYAIKACP